MKQILNLFLSDKSRILSFCESHAKEIASTFLELSKDSDFKVNLKNQFQLEFNIYDEHRKLRVLIREKMIHRFFVDMSFDNIENRFNEGSNAALGVIDRSGSYSLLSFSLWSLSRYIDERNFTKYTGSIAETVRDVICRTIPEIYAYGSIKSDVLYSLVGFYQQSQNRQASPQVIEPSTWVKWYGKDISLWSAPRGSFLRNVDVSSWGVTLQQLDFAFGDASVILPGGVKPGDLNWPKHWPVWEMEWRYEDWFDSDGKLHLALPGFSAEWRKWQSDPHSYRPPLPPES